MRRSAITWHLTFAKDPAPAELRRVGDLLGPSGRERCQVRT